MAKKKSKGEGQDLGTIVGKLVEEVGDDRKRLVKFLDDLISEYNGEKAVGIAEYVAKLADALTKQHQVKAVAVKALVKGLPDEGDDGMEDLQKEIGMPFKEDSGAAN